MRTVAILLLHHEAMMHPPLPMPPPPMPTLPWWQRAWRRLKEIARGWIQ